MCKTSQPRLAMLQLWTMFLLPSPWGNLRVFRANGAGKAKTIRLLTVTLTPDAGMVFYQRRRCAEKPCESEINKGHHP